MDNRPNHTLYVNNLNDKIKKPDLRRAIYYLFCQYGKVLDIVAMKTSKMRGQAFVVFKDISSAITAMRALQGFNFFDKPMRLHYARKDSTQIIRIKDQSAEAQKKREDEKEKRKKKKAAQRAALAAALAQPDTEATVNGDAKEDEKEISSGTAAPNKILYVSNLPSETTEDMLTMLFSQFNGFKEVRQISGRSDIAFIEYESEAQAETAQSAYAGFKLTPTHPIKIEYAKK